MRDVVNKAERSVCVCVCEYLDEYVEALEASGRKSISVDAVRRGAGRCCRELEAIHPGIRLEDVGDREVVELRRALEARLKESTLRNYLTDFGGYAAWVTGRDPVKHARLMWNGRADVDRVWITSADYRRLYSVAGPRERVILALGATMGLRREEIMTLSVDSIGEDGIVVVGKGHGNGKEAWKPLSEGARRAIAEYMPAREEAVRRAGRDPGTLILSKSGTPMHKVTANHLLDAVGERAGVKVTPHSLRRLYATTMADAGVDLETMARMMRHSSPSTTMAFYLRADPRRMALATDAVDAALTL